MEITMENDIVHIKLSNSGTIRGGGPEVYLLYAILEKLEEIRCGIIDVEDGIQKASDRPYSR